MKYKIEGVEVDESLPRAQHVLALAHSKKARPLCVCRSEGVEMYIAKLGEKYIVKRMPDSGHKHSMNCDAFEPPPELSGMGPLQGGAIKNNMDGTTLLKLGFSLSKSNKQRAAPAPSTDGKPESVKSDDNKLTLRGVAHLLWEHSGLTRWTPAMKSKRNWSVIQRHLKLAAQDKVAKGSNLTEQLYIPEPFFLDKKDEIVQRRRAQLLRLSSGGGSKQLMIVVGEVKEFSPSRFGHKMVLKHAADYSFMLPDDLHRKMLKAFEKELALWDAFDNTHLIAVGTFGCNSSGIASMENLLLMNVTSDWLPFEDPFEKELLDKLITEERRFQKTMRFNLKANVPIACAVLTDVGEEPLALYVKGASVSEEYEARFDQLLEESKVSSWVWDVENMMPVLPR